jgi:ATP-dependent exoDNAse (exonuclease V) alpha subunit
VILESRTLRIGERPVRLRGDELLVLAHTNDDVKRLNEALRKVMTADDGALTATAQLSRRNAACASSPPATASSSSKMPASLNRARKASGPQYVKNGMLGTVVSTGDKRGESIAVGPSRQWS